MDALLAIGRAIGSTLDLDEVLRLVIDHTSRLLQAERSSLFLVDPARREVWSKVMQGVEGIQEFRMPLGEGIAGWVCAHGEPVIVHDAAKDPRFNPRVDRVTGFRTRSMVVVPVRGRSGEVIGAIQALNRRHSRFGVEDRELLEAIAAQSGVAIENARLYRDAVQAKEALAESVAELDVLYDIERKISAASTLESLLDAILAKAVEVIGAEAGSVLVLQEEDGTLHFKSALGAKAAQIKSLRLPLGEGIAGRVAQTGEPVLSNDVSSNVLHSPRIGRRIGFAARSVLCVPLAADARVVGALELINRKGDGRFDQHDLRLATLIAGQMARAVAVARERDEGERRARLAMIGQMLAGILHDLRTPMTVIGGYAELMAEEAELYERRRSAEVILKQLEHINAMARETLAFVRGEREILLRKVHLNAFLDEVGELLSRDLKQAGIGLRIQAAYKGAVRMDEAKIKRAICNIARNAAQAMPQGGRFTISVDKEADRVVFRLSDTGTGIPDEIADRLFQSFVTSGKKEGTGLGLAIVKKIVEEHGGEVSVRSKPGKGATFVLKIPA
ncbi:MAG: GAF domain-containing protein [Myxococcales bacterium]